MDNFFSGDKCKIYLNQLKFRAVITRLNWQHFCRPCRFVSSHEMILAGVEGAERGRKKGGDGSQLAVQDVSAVYEKGRTRPDVVWSRVTYCSPTGRLIVCEQCLSFSSSYSPTECTQAIIIPDHFCRCIYIFSRIKA